MIKRQRHIEINHMGRPKTIVYLFILCLWLGSFSLVRGVRNIRIRCLDARLLWFFFFLFNFFLSLRNSFLLEDLSCVFIRGDDEFSSGKLYRKNFSCLSNREALLKYQLYKLLPILRIAQILLNKWFWHIVFSEKFVRFKMSSINIIDFKFYKKRIYRSCKNHDKSRKKGEENYIFSPHPFLIIFSLHFIYYIYPSSQHPNIPGS